MPKLGRLPDHLHILLSGEIAHTKKFFESVSRPIKVGVLKDDYTVFLRLCRGQLIIGFPKVINIGSSYILRIGYPKTNQPKKK
jgi:hypothetical protein